MDIIFKEFKEEHRIPVIDILNFYIENTTSAYRSHKVGYEHYDNFLDDSVLSAYVVLYEKDVLGFCTLEKYKSISTFNNTADMMYFLKQEYTGKGIGKIILAKLESDARSIGIKKLVVDIADDNSNSLKFHKNNGFLEYGRLKKCWNKNNKEIGIVFMEKEIFTN